MKIERFKYHEKFCVKSTFLDTSIDVEGTIDPGETLQEAVTKAREEIIKSLPKQELDKQELLTKYAGYVAGISLYTSGGIPTISKDNEKLEISIDNCASLDELATFKELAGKAGLVSAYMRKLNELTTNI